MGGPPSQELSAADLTVAAVSSRFFMYKRSGSQRAYQARAQEANDKAQAHSFLEACPFQCESSAGFVHLASPAVQEGTPVEVTGATHTVVKATEVPDAR